MATELTPKQQLQAIFALLSERSRWTQYTLARDAENTPVDPSDSTAVCWCAEGALRKVNGLKGDDGFYGTSVNDAWKLMQAMSSVGVVQANDQSGYETVMEIITKAMEFA